MKIKHYAKPLTGALLTLGILVSASTPALADTTEISFETAAFSIEAMTSDEVLMHMEGLVNIGSRLMGTPNEVEAAEYIEDVMLESYDDSFVSIEEFELSDARKTPVAAVTLSGEGEQFGADGKKIYYGNLYGYDESLAFSATDSSLIVPINGTFTESDDFTGKFPAIALSVLTASDITVTQNQAAEALAAAVKVRGAIGLIIYNDVPNSNDLIGRMIFRDEFAPVLPILAFDGVAGQLFVESKDQIMTIESYERGDSSNVVAIKPATDNPDDPSAIIHITGHFDSVMGAPGANDNATGAVGVLALAKAFADVDTGSVELRFAALGAEEGGLNGSVAYVAELTQQEKDISINMNMDMIATDETFVDALSLDIYGGVFNLPAALIIGATQAEGFTLLDDTKNVRYFNYGGSDHVNFQKEGMNATSMITVIDEDDMTENEYHLPSDNIEQNYSLDRHMQSISLMAGGIATAIAHNLTLDADLTLADGTITIENAAELAALFPTIKAEFVSVNGDPTITVELDTATQNTIEVPQGGYNLTVTGNGYGLANMAGTFGNDKVEGYSEELASLYLAQDATDGELQNGDQVALRGQFVSMLSDAADATIDGMTTAKFTDVTADSEHAQAIAWASDNAIVNGVSSTQFAPNMYLTNEQLAVILVNYSTAMAVELPSENAAATFENEDSISAWAYDAVMTLQTAGLINADTFDPQGMVTLQDAANQLADFFALIG